MISRSKNFITIIDSGHQIMNRNCGYINKYSSNMVKGYLKGALVEQINSNIGYSNYNDAKNNFKNYSIVKTGIAYRIYGSDTGQLVTDVYDQFTQRLYGKIFLNETGTWNFRLSSLDDRYALKIHNASGCRTGCSTGHLFSLTIEKPDFYDFDSYWTQDRGGASYTLQYQSPSMSDYANMNLNIMYHDS